MVSNILITRFCKQEPYQNHQCQVPVTSLSARMKPTSLRPLTLIQHHPAATSGLREVMLTPTLASLWSTRPSALLVLITAHLL